MRRGRRLVSETGDAGAGCWRGRQDRASPHALTRPVSCGPGRPLSRMRERDLSVCRAAIYTLPSPAAGEGGEPQSGEPGEGRCERVRSETSARALRRNATDAERAMWRLLRDRRLEGVKFRRRCRSAPLLADFASIAHRLVVELDGGQHAESTSDARRDAYLASEGWRVVRFWNNDVSA